MASTGMYAAAPIGNMEVDNPPEKNPMYPVVSLTEGWEVKLPQVCPDVLTGDQQTLAALEQRQIAVIDTLKTLISRAEAAITKLGGEITTAAPAPTGVFIGKHGEEVPLAWRQLPSAGSEITITAHPEKISPASFLIIELLRGEGKTVEVREYWHGGSTGLKAPSVEKLRALRDTKREKCSVRVNFIWKEVEIPSLVVSSAQNIAIEGENNIVKYLGRAFCPKLYAEDFIEATKIDGMMDTADKLSGNSRSQKTAMKEPNAILGKSKYVVGETMSLADIYLWSCIVSTGASCSGNVKKWKAALDENTAFVNAASSYEAICA